MRARAAASMPPTVYNPDTDPLMGRLVSVFTLGAHSNVGFAAGAWQKGIILNAETGIAIVNGVVQAWPDTPHSFPVPLRPQRETPPRVRVGTGFRPAPRVMIRAQARGAWAVLSLVIFSSPPFCPRQQLVRAQRPRRLPCAVQ